MASIISNEVVKTILERRSIRSFTPEQISEDQLETILTCGFNAPSGGNVQSWFLTVVQDAGLLGEINAEFVKMVKAQPVIPPIMVERLKNPNYSVFFNAPTAILVCYETEKGPANSSFLAENMVLAAQSLGLGTCYIGGVLQFLNSPAGDHFLPALKIPAGHTPAYFVSIGYPNESPAARPRDFSKMTRI
jgi:nitroreductase